MRRKKIFYAALCAATALAVGFSACTEDDENGSDDGGGGTYTLPDNVTEEDTKNLVASAIATFATTDKLTIKTSTAQKAVGAHADSYTEEAEIHSSVSDKKMSFAWISSGIEGGQAFAVKELGYVEGEVEYYYYEYNNEVEAEKTPVSTDADAYYRWDELDGIFDDDATYTVENGKLVWEYEDGKTGQAGNDVRRIEYTFDEQKRLKQIEATYKSIRSYNTTITSSQEVTFTYGSASPAMPAGYKPADFTDKTADYRYATVSWGNGKGTNKFWGEKSGSSYYLYPSRIWSYAPLVDGKELSSVKVGSVTYSRNGGDINISADNSTQIETVWSAAATSAAAKRTSGILNPKFRISKFKEHR